MEPGPHLKGVSSPSTPAQNLNPEDGGDDKWPLWSAYKEPDMVLTLNKNILSANPHTAVLEWLTNLNPTPDRQTEAK